MLNFSLVNNVNSYKKALNITKANQQCSKFCIIPRSIIHISGVAYIGMYNEFHRDSIYSDPQYDTAQWENSFLCKLKFLYKTCVIAWF